MTTMSGNSSEETTPQDPSHSSPPKVHGETMTLNEGQSALLSMQQLQERLEQNKERTHHLEPLLQQALEKTNGLSMRN